MDKPTDSEIIDRLGGTTEVARICQIKPPSVSEWRSTGIPSARRQFLALLRPEAFEDAALEVTQTRNAEIRALVDSRMSKRALRQKFGFRTDAHLAKVLGVGVEVIEAWGEGENVPATLAPAVMKLLGHEEQPAQQRRPQDPDADRIVTLEVA